MRVSILGPEWIGRWVEYTAAAFQTLGWEVDAFHYLGVPEFDRAAFNQLVRQRVPAFRPDLFLIIKGEVLAAETLRDLKASLRIPFAAWWGDDPYRTDAGGLHVMQNVDYTFMMDSHFVQRLSQDGLPRVYYLPLAADPQVYKRTLPYGAPLYQLCFVGTWYPNREQLLRSLQEQGYSLKIYGNFPWRSSSLAGCYGGGELSAADCTALYNQSLVGVNIHHPQLVAGVNSRTFEIAACGTAQMVDAHADLAGLFNLETEIIPYHNAGELLELARHYLAHPLSLAVIGENARQRVLAEHTYLHRVRTLLNVMGIG